MTEYTAYALARLAECASPDSPTSPGAEFLNKVARDFDDMEEPRSEDQFFSVADAAVPIFTHERWQVFVDLAAYCEDVTEFGPIKDMWDGAGTALLIIAERLLHALYKESLEGDEDDEDDEEEEEEEEEEEVTE